MWVFGLIGLVILIILVFIFYPNSIINSKNELKNGIKENFITMTMDDAGKEIEVEEKFTDDMIEDVKGIFKRMSSGQVQKDLPKPYKEELYTPGTMSQYIFGNVDEITNRIIGPYKNRLKRSDYDRIHVKISPDKTKKQYEYEAMIYDTLGSIQVKALINVLVEVKPGETRTPNTCTDITNYPFSQYSVGIPCDQQMIPLPTQVIPTANMVLSDKGVQKRFFDEIINFHLNGIKIENSTLVPNPGEEWNDNLNLTDLFSRAIKTPVEKARVYNQWPQLPGLTDRAGHFSVKNPFVWNSLGVPNKMPKLPGNPGNSGYTYATIPPEATPDYWPFNVRGPKFGGPNLWLFDLGRNIPSFPHGRGV